MNRLRAATAARNAGYLTIHRRDGRIGDYWRHCQREACAYVAITLRTRRGIDLAYFEVNSDPADFGYGHRFELRPDEQATIAALLNECLTPRGRTGVGWYFIGGGPYLADRLLDRMDGIVSLIQVATQRFHIRYRDEWWRHLGIDPQASLFAR